MQRVGYPNVSIKLYQNYDAWLENRFIELGGTFTTLTIRDDLYGTNEGMLQIYDHKNMHTKLDGDQILQISVGNANTSISKTRIYAVKYSSVSVDQKGDNIITMQLISPYKNKNLKFSRVFFKNATETIEEMINVLYTDAPLLKPTITGTNIHVPLVPWVLGIKEYMDYVRDTGISVASDMFALVWDDFNGIHITDFQQIINSKVKEMVVGEPLMVGQFADQLEYPLAYDFEWITKTNSYNRNPYENSTIYSFSMIDKNCTRIVNGNGENSILVSRNGGYSDQLFRNGYEEATKLNTMAQYDSYAKCTTYGDFDITPGTKLEFYDPKNQFLSTFYVDSVIHEMSNNQSFTHIYMFSNSKVLKPVDHIKVKNEIKDNSSVEED